MTWVLYLCNPCHHSKDPDMGTVWHGYYTCVINVIVAKTRHVDMGLMVLLVHLNPQVQWWVCPTAKECIQIVLLFFSTYSSQNHLQPSNYEVMLSIMTLTWLCERHAVGTTTTVDRYKTNRREREKDAKYCLFCYFLAYVASAFVLSAVMLKWPTTSKYIANTKGHCFLAWNMLIVDVNMYSTFPARCLNDTLTRGIWNN